MKKPRVYDLRLTYHAKVVFENVDSPTQARELITDLIVNRLSERPITTKRISVTESDTSEDYFEDNYDRVFIDEKGNAGSNATPWLESLEKIDIFSRTAKDDAYWEDILREYSEVCSIFGDALSHPSDFPRIEQYDGDDDQIVFFMVQSEFMRLGDKLTNEARNRRDYYLLKFPKLRDGLSLYRSRDE
jgi:hypothetical protein